MSVRAILVTWLVAAILVIAAVVAGRQASDERTTSAVAARVHATPIPVDEVDRVVVDRTVPGEDRATRLVFVRDTDGWRQESPFEVAADGFAIRQLVVAAADLVATRRTPVDEAIAETGLDRLGLEPPDGRIELGWPGGETVVELGARTVAGRAWIRIDEDDDLLVVDDGLHERAVDDDPRNWRSRRLFPSDAEIASVRLDNGGVETRLQRDGRRWLMASPLDTRADAEALDRLAGVLGRVEHDGFVADAGDDLERFGLADPAASLRVERDDGTVETLRVGGPSGLVGRDRFAMVEGVPTIVRLDEATLRGLLPAVTSLVDPTGTGVRPADVRQVVITTEAGEVRLERDLDRWIGEISADNGTGTGVVDPSRVDRLFELLADTRAIEIMVQDHPRELEVATVVFHGFDGRPMDAVRIAREPDAGRWALENGDGVLRLHPSSTDFPLFPGDYPLSPDG